MQVDLILSKKIENTDLWIRCQADEKMVTS